MDSGVSLQSVGRDLKRILGNAWGEDPRCLREEPQSPSFAFTTT